jgi:uncharacterized protein (TIGR03435 family)
MSPSIRAVVVTGSLLFSCLLTTAQTRSFDVVSVKPAPAKGFVPPVINPISFRIVCNLADAIEWAYELEAYQLAGGPSWLRGDYYQIEGRTQSPATRKEMRSMLQRVLTERFKLKFHMEARQKPIFALKAGDPDSRLQASLTACGVDGCINVAPGVYDAKSATMDSIAAILSNMVDRPVLNQTGLPGRYDFRIKFDPASVRRFDGQTVPGTSTDDPSIFAAFQNLGLKMEPTRAAIQTFVIDNAAKPSPN